MAHEGGNNPMPDITKALVVINPKESRADWFLLREEWITTNISIAALAKKYRLKFREVREIYERQRWADSLREYQATIEDQLKLKRIDKAQAVADRLTILDEQVVDLSEKAIDFLDQLIDDTKKERETEVKEDKITVRDAIVNIKLAVDTIRAAYGNIRLANGKSTANLGLTLNSDLTADELKRIDEEFKFLQASDINVKPETDQ